MNKKTGMLAVFLAGIFLMSGLGLAAQYGWSDGPRDEDNDKTPNRIDTDYERPMDGRNSPWVIEDERLDRFQERFELSDAQMEEIKKEIDALSEEEIDHEEIEVIVERKLKGFGINDPELGGPREGSRGRGRKARGNYENCPYVG